MSCKNELPVFNINNFEDYNHCMQFDNNFYVRTFKDHLRVNQFIDKPHGHDFYLILLVTKGNGTHNIDFNEYKVEPRSMFILSPGQVHQWELSPETDGYVMFFTKQYFLLDFNHDRLTRLPFFKSSFSIPYLKLDAMDQKIVEDSFQRINNEYNKHLVDYHEMIRLYLNVLFIELSRLYKTQHEDHIEYNYELIQLNRFETLIDDHYKEHAGLPFYADKMNISLKQLSHLCKKTIGKTPSEMIIERIILEAKRLIIHSDFSISTISETLNYSDNSYFIRMFKKVCKQTPEQFRFSYASRKKQLAVFHANKNLI